MAEPWTTLRVLDWTASRLERAQIEAPRLEAQILLAHVLQCDRVALYTAFERPLADEELAGYRGLIQRRLAGESVAYLVGMKEFWSREFAVDARVLVPRADTETLVEWAIECAKSAPAGAIADVGTGSGAIAVTMACESTDRPVIAVDISSDALELARRNAETHGVGDRVDFRQGNLAKPLEGEEVALLLANLPYVEAGEIEHLAAEVRAEPRLALDGGTDGLDLIRELVSVAALHVVAGGFVALEHGHDQGGAVRDLLSARAEFDGVETREDLGGRPRITFARKRASRGDAEPVDSSS